MLSFVLAVLIIVVDVAFKIAVFFSMLLSPLLIILRHSKSKPASANIYSHRSPVEMQGKAMDVSFNSSMILRQVL